MTLAKVSLQSILIPILKLYEKASTSKMFFSKSCGSWLGSYENRNDKLGNMKWSQSLTKILVIHFGDSILNLQKAGVGQFDPPMVPPPSPHCAIFQREGEALIFYEF